LRAVLGIDIGSVSVKMAVLDENKKLRAHVYLETAGAPVESTLQALGEIRKQIDEQALRISGVGVTGSGRKLAALLLGADIVKNEVTAQTIAALHYDPDVSSIIEIGGQDSKVIILENGIPVWHNLNTLCAAGTGSFLSSQALRLKVPIEKFGEHALRSKVKVNIAAKCTVFSESDMIHKAALGYKKEDIINGLCEALVRNFVNNVTRNRSLRSPTVFAGGVAANQGVVKAFERELGHAVIVPEEHRIMGCIGMALLTLEQKIDNTGFKGFDIIGHDVRLTSHVCEDCPNQCEITGVLINDTAAGYLNSRCGKYG